MDDQEFIAEGQNYLLQFFAAYNAWQVLTNIEEEGFDWPNRTEEEDRRWSKERRDALVEIYREFCEKGGNAKRLRDIGFSYTKRPPDDLDFEKIVSGVRKGEIVVVETRCEREGWWAQYEVIKLADGWKVRDSKRWKCNPDSKWSRSLL